MSNAQLISPQSLEIQSLSPVREGRCRADSASMHKLKSWLGIVAFVAAVAVARLCYLLYWCQLDIATDEAHYWDWSNHLDWSYYSKGPLVAFLIWLGGAVFGEWSQSMVGSPMLAVRIPAILCGSLLLLALFALTERVYRSQRLAWLMVIGALSLPVLSVGATLMTIDAPYTCCWAWALVLGHKALFDRANWAWPVLGIIIGIGILAKYTMILWFPSLGLFLLFSPKYRHYLWHWGFWLSATIAAFCTFPIVIWNIQNDWIGLLHVGHQAGVRETERQFTWLGPLIFLGTQFGLLLGFWFVAWVRAMWARAPWKEANDQMRFLWWMSAFTFGLFFSFGIVTRGGQANWAITAYLSGMVLTLGWLLEEIRSSSQRQRRVIWLGMGTATAVGLLLIVHMHFPSAAFPVLCRIAGESKDAKQIPVRKLDPTTRMRGYQTLAKEVDERVRALRARGIDPIVACGSWTIPGVLKFYCREEVEIYCIGVALGTRHSQYDLWQPNPISHPQQYQGRTILFVGDYVSVLDDAFTHQDPTETIFHRDNGQSVVRWDVTIYHGYKGFPYSMDFNRSY